MIVDFWINPSMNFTVFVGPPIKRESREFNLLDLGDLYADRASSVFNNKGLHISVVIIYLGLAALIKAESCINIIIRVPLSPLSFFILFDTITIVIMILRRHSK